MDETTIRAKAEEFIEALHALENAETGSDELLDGLAELYAQDARLTNSALRLTNEEMAGQDAIRTFWDEYKKTVGKANSVFHQVTVSGEAVGLFWVTEGITTPDQPEPRSYDGSTLLVFDEAGKIRHFQGYYDTHQFNRTIGREQ
jgi:ketosteroid isomerase-like protein